MIADDNDAKVEVSIGGTATVLAKYAPVIALMSSTETGMWQEVVDAWVQVLRQMAVAANMEVDDLIGKILAEAAEEDLSQGRATDAD